MAGESRYSVYNQPPKAPGCCFICKSVNDSPFVDSGLYLPFEGVVYIGANCLTEMFRMIEPSDKYEFSQVLSVRDQVAELARNELNNLFIQVGEAINDARTRVGLGTTSILPDAFDFSVPDLEDDGGAEGFGFGDESNVDAELDRVNESNVEGSSTPVVEGPDDLSGDSSDGDSESDGRDRGSDSGFEL